MPFTVRLLSELTWHLYSTYTRARDGGMENHGLAACVLSYVVTDEGSIVEEKISRGRFIRLGTALGVSAASASVLAACGGSSESGGGSGGGSDGGSGGGSGNGSGGGGYGGNAGGGSKKPKAPGGKAIAETSEVAPGSAVAFKDSGSPAVLVHLDNGDFVAYSAVCTHQGCTVAYKNGQLACPCHGSVFDPANGAEVVAGPAPRPLPKIPVKVSGGEVFMA
jgi:cytochrome b6-f complex iron-sulfur subunit